MLALAVLQSTCLVASNESSSALCLTVTVSNVDPPADCWDATGLSRASRATCLMGVDFSFPVLLADLMAGFLMADSMPYSAATAAQAMAASWAASCCHQVHPQALEIEFHILHLFFSAQHGLDQIVTAHGQLDFATKPGCSPLETTVAFLVETQAVRQHHKPGGWSAHDCKMLLRHLEKSRPAAGHGNCRSHAAVIRHTCGHGTGVATSQDLV